MNTILITGASSGYGLETARHFHSHGWRVIATMRTPRKDALPESDRIEILQLDVTDPDSIAAAFAKAGPIDVLVNNAGIGGIGVVEAMPLDKARELFETNTFAVMATTKAEPGYCPTTRFTANGGDLGPYLPETYAGFTGPILEAFSVQGNVTTPTDVAEAIWRAVHDTTGTLRFPAGPDAVALAQVR